MTRDLRTRPCRAVDAACRDRPDRWPRDRDTGRGRDGKETARARVHGEHFLRRVNPFVGVGVGPPKFFDRSTHRDGIFFRALLDSRTSLSGAHFYYKLYMLRVSIVTARKIVHQNTTDTITCMIK